MLMEIKIAIVLSSAAGGRLLEAICTCADRANSPLLSLCDQMLDLNVRTER